MSEDISNVELAAAAAVVWLENPKTKTDGDGIVQFLSIVAKSLDTLTDGTDDGAEDHQPKPEPAVSVRKSLADDEHILSLLDGKPYKTLRRHLSTRGYTPESYREAFGLKASYPMVSKGYAAKRSEMAKSRGFGRRAAPAAGPDAPTAAPRKPRSRQTPPVVDVGTVGGEATS